MKYDVYQRDNGKEKRINHRSLSISQARSLAKHALINTVGVKQTSKDWWVAEDGFEVWIEEA